MTDNNYAVINYPQVTELDLIVAELLFPILVELAPSGNTIGYKEIADLIKKKHSDIPEIKSLHHRHIGRRLGTIWKFTEKQGCPHIGALVISQNTGECGIGITSFLDPVLEREKIKKFDWSSVELGFKAYLNKTKSIQKEYKKKKIKRTRDEAKQLFFDYWKQVKEEVPVPKNEVVSFREHMIDEVKDGISPEEALSNALIKYLETHNQKNTDKVGFVYIGEYVNSESKEKLFNEVKIGYTTDLESRSTALGGGVLGPLEFLIKYAWEFEAGYAYAVEQRLHGELSEYRKNGEFFLEIDGLIPELVCETIETQFNDISQVKLIDGEAV